MLWPSFFPPNCPCPDSHTVDCEVYRFIKGEEPTPEDFKSHRERFPTKKYSQPECVVCGLSIYLEVGDVKRVQDRIPAFKNKHLVKGNICDSHGVVKNTVLTCSESSHHTWWVPLEASPWTLFHVVLI